MKVRLAAEEYFEHASLRARFPTRRADLLRRGLGLPLARRAGDRPRNSVCLGGNALSAAVARPASSRPRDGHSGAGTQAGDKRRPGGSPDRAFRSRVRNEGGTTRVRDHATARESLAPRYLAAGRGEARRSDPVAAEPSAAVSAASSTGTQPAASSSPATASPATATATHARGLSRHNGD